MDKRAEWTFSKDVKMANMKKYSISKIIEEMANQKQNKILSHLCQDGYYQKHKM